MIWAQTALANDIFSLVIVSDEPERVLACLPLEEETPFHIDFINSIYSAPVRETFIYTKAGGIFITRVKSSSAGVFEYYGLIPDKNGTAELYRSVGEIKIKSYSYENHWLTLHDTRLNFKKLAAGGQLLIINVWPDCNHRTREILE